MIDPEKAAQLAAMVRTSGGKLYLAEVKAQYEQTLKTLLYAPVVDVEALRGKARGLFETIRFFEEVEATVNEGRGHGST